MFALADINSFYASCEKVFRPDLRNEPVIVVIYFDIFFIKKHCLSPIRLQMSILRNMPVFHLLLLLPAPHRSVPSP